MFTGSAAESGDADSRVLHTQSPQTVGMKPWQTYLFAVVITAAVLGIRLALDGPLEGQPALVLFAVPIVLSSYVGGFGPGLLATALSLLFASYFLLAPVHSFLIASTAEIWQQFCLALAGIVISASNGALHRARHRADIATHDRQQAELAMLKAGALQRAIFNSANFSSIATDAKGVIQIFNVGAERMLGYTAAEVMNKVTPADISDPQELIVRAKALSDEVGAQITPGFEALVFKAYRGMEDIYELTYIRKDGTRFPAVVSVTGLRDAQDAIIGYLLIGTDNTARQKVEEDRKMAEEARHTSEVRYRILFESAPDGIVVADSNSYYLDVNGSICRMLGYSREELIGMHASDIVAKSETQHIGQALAVINANSVYHREWQFRRKDGSLFHAEVIATRMPDGNLLAMIRDITDRRLSEILTANAMRELNYVKEALDEHAIVTITDPKGRITYVNDKFCEISQYSREDVLGKDHRIINSGLHSKEFIRDIWETIGDGRVWKGEIRNKAKDGSFYWVDMTIVPYLSGDGTPVQYIAIRTDITEQKLFERALQQTNLELEDTSRMKSEFLATMSHELRTPLNSIIGFSEVLKEGLLGDMPDKQRGFIGDIYNSGNHLLSLINDILDMSKVEAGRMTLDLELLDISLLLTNSLSVIREKAVIDRIQVDVQLCEGLALIQADSRKVKQIVYNLLSNAVKFTPEGGQVTLRAALVPRAEVGQLSGRWVGRSFPLAPSSFPEFLRISVVDSGIGISADALKILFKPFSQIDSGLARKFEGTGLGLAMVKLLTELHEGSVAVESAPGEGSCFTVWLPMRAPKEDSPMHARQPAVPHREALAGAPVALVVEDDYKSAELIRVQLEAEGFKVLHAASAEAALALAVQQPVSLITLDILLPNMEGWEFLSRIKQIPDLRQTPVVIISIVAESHRGISLGAAAVLQKPVSRQQLYESLVELGLFPLSQGRTLKVLVVDDDSKAVELIAVNILGPSSSVLRAYGGREAIDMARRELPDLIVLDLMMPEVSGFDVVAALKDYPDTAGIPIVVVTAKQINDSDRAKLSRNVTAIMEKAEFNPDRFTAEVRRAMSGRDLVI